MPAHAVDLAVILRVCGEEFLRRQQRIKRVDEEAVIDMAAQVLGHGGIPAVHPVARPPDRVASLPDIHVAELEGRRRRRAHRRQRAGGAMRDVRQLRGKPAAAQRLQQMIHAIQQAARAPAQHKQRVAARLQVKGLPSRMQPVHLDARHPRRREIIQRDHRPAPLAMRAPGRPGIRPRPGHHIQVPPQFLRRILLRRRCPLRQHDLCQGNSPLSQYKWRGKRLHGRKPPGRDVSVDCFGSA